MKIQSKPYGEIRLGSDRPFRLIGGLVGFEGMERFVVIGRRDEYPFRWLQSLDDPSLAMVVLPVDELVPQYRMPMKESQLRQLQVRSVEELDCYAIVVVPENPREMTANLRGPLLVNHEDGVGMQTINPVDEHGTRFRILDESPVFGSSFRGGNKGC